MNSHGYLLLPPLPLLGPDELSGKLMVELIPASPVGSRGGFSSMQQTDSPNEEERSIKPLGNLNQFHRVPKASRSSRCFAEQHIASECEDIR